MAFHLATAADAEALGQCFGRYRDWKGFAGPTDDEFTDEISIALAQDSEFLVSGRPPHGFLYYQFMRSLWMRGEICLIEILFVDESHRGQGIGRALLLTVEERAKRRGVQRMEFHANAANTQAVTLYESEGFSAHNNIYDGTDLYFRKPM